jgi:glycosyltransferase involved in cell wall biosynthesis
MRVAFLTHEPLFPPSGGGSAEAVYLVGELVRRGHEVHVFCPAIADAAALTGRLDVHLHLFDTWEMGRYTSFRNLKYLLYPRQLVKMVTTTAEGLPFDLIVAQHTISAVAAGRLRASLKVPVVMNFLDFLTGFMETWPAWLMPRLVLRRLNRFEITLPSRSLADGVMTVSDPLAELFAGAGYPWQRICPIYYGYDAEKFPLRKSPRRDATAPVVIMHGSFDKHHLGPIAQESMIAVHRQRPDVRFKFVGRETGTLTSHLKAVRIRAPDLQVETTGFVPYDQIAGHLAAATVGMIPYEESTGTHCAFVAKAVEYLGVGLPVVSTRLRNLAQYFKHESRLRFSDFSAASFAGQILGWLNDPARDEESAAAGAAARVREKLDWQAIARRAVDFLEKTRNDFR